MKFTIRLFRNDYRVRIFWGYCGAIMTRKEPEPGETWLRGRDCLDGRLSKLPAVLWDIVSCEFGIGRFSTQCTPV